jgi:hypothetical protein
MVLRRYGYLAKKIGSQGFSDARTAAGKAHASLV